LIKLKKLLNDTDYYDHIVDHVRRMRDFPPPMRAGVWKSVKAHWVAEGEAAFAQKFEELHIDKNGGWVSGSLAFGVTTVNNPLENNNNHGIKKPLRSALIKKLKIPTGEFRWPQKIGDVMEALFDSHTQPC
jgi:hypothetical protein